jgi:Tol biopolymer transport system component
MSTFKQILFFMLTSSLIACSGSRQGLNEDVVSTSPVVTAGAGGSPELYHIAAGDQAHPTVSYDGSMLAYQSNIDGNWEIYLQAVTGGTPIRLTDDTGSDEDPAFAPDGQKLLFTWSSPDLNGDGQRDIYMIDRDGDNRRVIVQSSADDWAPRYLSDGSGFIFLSDRGAAADAAVERNRTLYHFSFIDDSITPLAGSNTFTGGAGSIDSDNWLLTTRDGWYRTNSLILQDTLQAPSQLLVQAGVEPLPGSESLAVCFGEAVQGERRIFLVNLISGSSSPLTEPALDARWPAVNPAGTLLYFCARENDPSAVFNLYSLPLTAGASGR